MTTALSEPNDARDYIRLGRELSTAGRSSEAIEAFERACSMSRGCGSLDVTAEALRRLSGQAWMDARLSAALTYAQSILELPLANDSPWRLEGYLALGHYYIAVYDGQRALEKVDEAQRCCEIANLDSLANLLEIRALAESMLGMPEEAVHDFRLSIQLARDRSATESTIVKCRNFAVVARNMGLTDLAIEMHEQALDAAVSLGGWRVPHVTLDYAWTAFTIGDLGKAVALLRATFSESSTTPQTVHIRQSALSALLGTLCVDTAVEKHAVETCVDEALASGAPATIGQIAAGFHEFYTVHVRPSDADTLITRALPALARPDGAEWLLVKVAESGAPPQVAQARRLMERLDSTTPPNVAWRALFSAWTLRRKGDAEGAVASAVEAQAVFGRLKWQYFRARALEAARRYSEARNLYSEMHSASDVNRLANLRGARGQLRTARGELTPRQREVMRLAGEGLTTPEIARRLGLAAKTVDWHLAAVFDRLGVPNRHALIRMVTESNLGNLPGAHVS